jgi:hypothetical protein
MSVFGGRAEVAIDLALHRRDSWRRPLPGADPAGAAIALHLALALDLELSGGPF